MLTKTGALEIYLAPLQWPGWIWALDVEKNLEGTGLINRALGLNDQMVLGWIADPSTYPSVLRKKSVVLWKSRMLTKHYRFIPHLIWSNEVVLVSWARLDLSILGPDNPALLSYPSQTHM